MSHPTVLVTTIGKTGSAVVEQLRARGTAVRAIARSDGARARSLRSLGAEVRVADIFDSRDVRAALDGVDAVYHATPFHPHALHASVVLAEAMRATGVADLVLLSQWLASPEHPSLATRQAWLTERMFSGLADVRTVVVNPGYFADNYLVMTGTAAQTGLFPVPMGTRRSAPPSTEDIARVVVGVLQDPGAHTGRRYRPTGPDLLSGEEMAVVIGRAVGRRVRHLDVPMWLYLRALHVTGARVAGVDDYTLAGAADYTRESLAGTWEIGAPTTHVRDVTGVDAEDFAVTAHRYATRPEFRRTPRTLARGALDAARILLTPTPDPARIAGRQAHPVLARPVLSADSSWWLAEHSDAADPARPALLRAGLEVA